MTASRITTPITRESLWMAAFLAVCVALFWQPLWQLLRLSLSQDVYSHILLVPFVTLALIVMNRTSRSTTDKGNVGAAAALMLTSALLSGLIWRSGPTLLPGGPLALTILSFLFLVWGGVALVYGTRAFFRWLFPLLFLLLLVPLPQPIIDKFIEWLQSGSAEVTYWLLRATGTPVLRHGYVFVVPKFTIEIASECSGIRSAVAMLITCLLAGYLFLRSNWSRVALLVATVPMLVIKNGVRIVTLTLLSIHVDAGFLHGSLHREGGFLFFLIGLLILWPVLWWLQHLEARRNPHPPAAPVLRSGMPA